MLYNEIFLFKYVNSQKNVKMSHFMNPFEKWEQRIIIKYCFFLGQGNKKIYENLSLVCGKEAYSKSQIKRWLQRFKNGNFSCMDEERAGRPLSDLAPLISNYLQKFPYSSAKKIAQYFDISHHTVKEILQRDLQMRKYSRKWVPYELSDENKKCRVECANGILEELRNDAQNNYEHICTGDESWYIWLNQSSSMFAQSREKVDLRIRQTISSKKTLITIFFTGTNLIAIDDLPKGRRFTQDYFINNIGDMISNANRRFLRKEKCLNFRIHMDNSKCHNGSKVTQFLADKKINRIPHPPYSPDMSPCDFWFFGRSKKLLEDVEITDSEMLVDKLIDIWNGISFEEIQAVYREWEKRCIWIIEHEGEYYPSQ